MEMTDASHAVGPNSAGAHRRAGSGGGRAAGTELRDQVWSYLETRLADGGGHATISTRAIADAFGVTSATVSHHLHALAAEGRIQTRSAGRKGLIISTPEPGRRGGRGRTARSAQAPAVRTAARAQGGPFCPWCGHQIRKEWHFCMTCGGKL